MGHRIGMRVQLMTNQQIRMMIDDEVGGIDSVDSGVNGAHVIHFWLATSVSG